MQIGIPVETVAAVNEGTDDIYLEVVRLPPCFPVSYGVDEIKKLRVHYSVS